MLVSKWVIFLNFSIFSITLVVVKKFKETIRISVIKSAYYFLRVKSKVNLIKDFEYGTLLLSAATFSLLFKMWPKNYNFNKKLKQFSLKLTTL